MSRPLEACPATFLASELAETSRLTRRLTTSAASAIEAITSNIENDDARAALMELMVALQAQDRIEQRLTRLEAYARHLGGTTASLAHETLEEALVLDELVSAFKAHTGRADATTAEDDCELF